jgi:GxxExxY protein
MRTGNESVSILGWWGLSSKFLPDLSYRQWRKIFHDVEMRSANELGHKELSGRVIAAAIEVHQSLGPGFLESIYESALCIELDLRHVRYQRQKVVPLHYRGVPVGEHRLDFLVEGVLVVELKAVKELDDIFFAVTRSYMKAVGVNDGILLTFASMPLTVKRVGREYATNLKNDIISGTQEIRNPAHF